MNFLVTGSTGKLGSALVELLEIDGHNIIKCSSFEILNLIELNEFDKIRIYMSMIIEEKKLTLNDEICVVFCHRIRSYEDRPAKAVSAEVELTNKIIDISSSYFKNLCIVWIGSCTGRLIDNNSSLAYHLVKDAQKTMARYFALTDPRIKANTIELSAFNKYPKDKWNDNYTGYIKKIEKHLQGRGIANVFDVKELLKFLGSWSTAINGQTVSLDNGFTKIQNFE